MITERGMASLRVAATLVHSVPWLRVRLCSGDTTVAEIGRPPDPGPVPAGTAGRWLSPCAFRAAVGQADECHRRGRELRLGHLSGDPAIEVGVPPEGRTFAGGIHRVPLGDRWLYAFALCADAEECAGLVPGVVGEQGALVPGAARLGLRPDALLRTTVCYVEIDGTGPGSVLAEERDRSAAELLGALLARFTAEVVCGSAGAGVA